MNVVINRRVYKSRIHPKYDINYYLIYIRNNRTHIFQKQLNPIYDLRKELTALKKQYKFIENIDDLINAIDLQRHDSIFGRDAT